MVFNKASTASAGMSGYVLMRSGKALVLPISAAGVMATAVAAYHVGVVVQRSGGQCFHRLVCAVGHTAVQPDARRGQCRLCAAADAAADQCVHVQRAQNACHCALAVTAGIHHFRGNDFAVFHIVDLELLRVAKV